MIAIVGPCTSGKSTLVERLRVRGYHVRSVAQEHSYVRDMWQKITQPDILIYLNVSKAVANQRRSSTLNWPTDWLDIQNERLRHASEHSDLFVDTGPLTADEIEARVVAFLEEGN